MTKQGELLAAPRGLKIGVSGHQQLGGAESVEWTRSTLRQALSSMRIGSGYTCLAAGADQLFASVLIEMDIPYIAVVPCANYDKSFASVKQLAIYHSLKRSSREAIALPFPEPSELAYLAAGKYIVQHTDKLIAIWNGAPARGPGGTGDVVNYALSCKQPVLHINPATQKVKELAAALP